VRIVVFNERASGRWARRGGWARCARVPSGCTTLQTDQIVWHFWRGASVRQIALLLMQESEFIESILRWYLQPENAKALQEARGK
jgi:hypothetical protein